MYIWCIWPLRFWMDLLTAKQMPVIHLKYILIRIVVYFGWNPLYSPRTRQSQRPPSGSQNYSTIFVCRFWMYGWVVEITHKFIVQSTHAVYWFMFIQDLQSSICMRLSLCFLHLFNVFKMGYIWFDWMRVIVVQITSDDWVGKETIMRIVCFFSISFRCRYL